MKFQKVKVTAYLSSPVICDGYKPLDAIIYSMIVREKLGAGATTKAKASSVPDALQIKNVFYKHNSKNDRWFNACSFAQWPSSAVYGKHMRTRRFEMEVAEKYIDMGKKKKIELKKGPYKNALLNDRTICAPYVSWFAFCEIERLEKYLAMITHIGKKSSGGVIEWYVEEWHDDWSVRGYGNQKGEFKKLMRSVPTRDETAPVYGLRPSYWLPKHQSNVNIPPVSIGMIDDIRMFR